jgi:hypothetical protein
MLAESSGRKHRILRAKQTLCQLVTAVCVDAPSIVKHGVIWLKGFNKIARRASTHVLGASITRKLLTAATARAGAIRAWKQPDVHSGTCQAQQPPKAALTAAEAPTEAIRGWRQPDAHTGTYQVHQPHISSHSQRRRHQQALPGRGGSQTCTQARTRRISHIRVGAHSGKAPTGPIRAWKQPDVHTSTCQVHKPHNSRHSGENAGRRHQGVAAARRAYKHVSGTSAT